MILKIIQTGQPLLRKNAKHLSEDEIKSDSIQQLIDLMILTLRDRPGVGLAAPQVGESLQIIIIEDKKDYLETIPDELLEAQGRKPVSLKVIINPILTIEENSETNQFFEGCLSVDGYAAIVPRANRVKVTGLDRDGQPIEISATGWLARILQHEVDHLHATLYVDKMLTKTFITDKHYAKMWAKALPAKLTGYIKKNS